MGHNCLHVRFFLLDLDLDLPSLKRTWTRTWTCSLKVDLDLDLDLRIVDLDFTVAGLVTSLHPTHKSMLASGKSFRQQNQMLEIALSNAFS